MRDEEVDLVPKMVMMIGSVLLYYGALFLMLRYKKSDCKPTLRFCLTLIGCAVPTAD